MTNTSDRQENTTMSTDLRAIPRAALNGYLDLLRLPVTAAESVTRRNADGERAWPPALAFDGFAAQVRDLAGSVLGDETLRQQATLLLGRVEQLRRAAELQAEAERKREEADRQLDQRRQQAEDERRQAEEQAEQQEERLERERADAERRVAEQAAEKERRAQEAADAERERVQQEERAAEARRLEAEREALAERKEAVDAKKRTANAAKAATATKQRRKAAAS
jgi:hypothetical protein